MGTNEIEEIQSDQSNDEFNNVASEQLNNTEVNNIDIPVMVVFGSTKLSLKKLHQLKLGDNLQLDKWNQLVKLYVYDQPIAEGILVDIGGVLGVKITHKIQLN